MSKALQIEGCSKLEVIFSASVLRSLPQLTYLEIKDCEGLQKIMEEDEENQRQSNSHSQQVCFPKLIALVVKRCHSLKSLIPVSTFREFPKLELMIINEASQLDNMFRNERGDEVPRLKLGLPKLKYLVLMQLPTLSDLSQHMELQAVTCSVVHHCPKLSFASTTTLEDLKNTLEDSNIDPDVHWELFEILETIIEETERESPMTETIPQLPVVQEVQGMQVQSASQREVPCSQIADEADKEIVAVHDSEMPTSSTDLDVITMPFPSPSVIHQCETPQSTKERMEQSLLECPEAEKAITSIMSTNSEPRIPSPGPLLIPLQEASSQSINGSVQEVSTSDETMMSPQLVEKLSLDEQISMKQGAIREHSNIGQNVKSSTNGSVSKVVLSKTALAAPAPSNLQELSGSALAPVGDLLNDASAVISPICETNVTRSTLESMQRMPRSLLEEAFNNDAKVDSLSPDAENSSSSLVLKPDPSSELKMELAGYLNMSLEAIIDANAFDHVERIVNSLARETKDAFQQNILTSF